MSVMQWVLIGFVVVLLIGYPLLMSRKNKKENEKMQEQTNSLKRGDEILTTAGVYGKILEVKQDGQAKKVVIETGSGKNKSTMTVDAYSIYTVLNKEPVKEPAKEEAKKAEEKAVEVKAGEVKSEENGEVKTEETSEVKAEEKAETVKSEDKKSATKKTPAKKTTKKNTAKKA